MRLSLYAQSYEDVNQITKIYINSQLVKTEYLPGSEGYTDFCNTNH